MNDAPGRPPYTIRVCYDVKGWAYYRRACALQKYAPPDFRVTIGPDYGAAFRRERHDLVLQLCYSYAKDIRRHIEANGYDIVLVTSFNVGFGYANSWLRPCLDWSDHVIINSRQCWERLGEPDRTTAISNGVDRELFPMITPPEARQPLVLWTGSRLHRKVKGYETYLLPVAERLRAEGMASDFRLVDSHGRENYRSAEQLQEWYNRGTVYVVASESEGTPNPALEAASSGCVVVSTPVGNMSELIQSGLNGMLVERTVDSLVAGVLHCQTHYVAMADAMQTAIESWHWRYRAGEYFSLFRRLIGERRRVSAGMQAIENNEAK